MSWCLGLSSLCARLFVVVSLHTHYLSTYCSSTKTPKFFGVSISWSVLRSLRAQAARGRSRAVDRSPNKIFSKNKGGETVPCGLHSYRPCHCIRPHSAS